MANCKDCNVKLTAENTYGGTARWKCRPCHNAHMKANAKARTAKERKNAAWRERWATVNVRAETKLAVRRLADERGQTPDALILELLAADYNSRQPKPRLGLLSRLFSL